MAKQISWRKNFMNMRNKRLNESAAARQETIETSQSIPKLTRDHLYECLLKCGDVCMAVMVQKTTNDQSFDVIICYIFHDSNVIPLFKPGPEDPNIITAVDYDQGKAYKVLIGETESGATDPKPNIVWIFTDDQDQDSLKFEVEEDKDPMPQLRKLIMKEGAWLDNFFVSTPSCCVSRSTFLTGMYSHNHNVTGNANGGGCYGNGWTGYWEGNKNNKQWTDGWEKHNIGNLLKNSAPDNTIYNTFHMGKYLNQYPLGRQSKDCCSLSDAPDCTGNSKTCECEIPPGFDSADDKWIATLETNVAENFCEDGKRVNMSKGHYLNVGEMSNKTDEFIRAQTSAKPFFMIISPLQPHGAGKNPEWPDMFDGEEPHWNEAYNTSGAHMNAFMRQAPFPPSQSLIERNNKKFVWRYQSLRSIDQLVANVVKSLNETGFLDNTYIFYTTDNGFHFTQFGRAYGKWTAYDFDTRVPFAIRGPGIPANIKIDQAIASIDVVPTILEMAGKSIPAHVDGKSMLTLLKNSGSDPNMDWRQSFLQDYRGSGGGGIDSACNITDLNFGSCETRNDCVCESSRYMTFKCVRGVKVRADNGRIGKNYQYCSFPNRPANESSTPWIEFYDIKKYPYQTVNEAKAIESEWATTYAQYQTRLEELMACSGTSSCS